MLLCVLFRLASRLSHEICLPWQKQVQNEEAIQMPDMWRAPGERRSNKYFVCLFLLLSYQPRLLGLYKEIWSYGIPELRHSGVTAVWSYGSPELRHSGVTAFRSYGIPELRRSGVTPACSIVERD